MSTGNTLSRRGFMAGTALAAGLSAAQGAQAQAEPAKATPAASNEGKLGVAMLSKWHAHAQKYARMVKNEIPNSYIAAVWDEDAARGEAWAKELEVEWVPDLAAILAREDVQAVVCDAPSNLHAEILVTAAQAGKHIFTEKVMALTIAECDQISKAVQAAGVKFCISFPFRTRRDTQYAKMAVDQGLLGQVANIRIRLAHDAGSAGWLPPHFWEPVGTGGGAMVDLGAHPMYLLRWLAGQPKKISTTFTHLLGKEVEDNAVSVIEFENNILAVAETGFTSTFNPFSLEISGTHGTLLIGGPEGKDLHMRSMKLPNHEWHTPVDLPKEQPHPLITFVDVALNGGEMPFGLEDGTQLTELMHYAYEAGQAKCQVEIPARTPVAV